MKMVMELTRETNVCSRIVPLMDRWIYSDRAHIMGPLGCLHYLQHARHRVLYCKLKCDVFAMIQYIVSKTYTVAAFKSAGGDSVAPLLPYVLLS